LTQARGWLATVTTRVVRRKLLRRRFRAFFHASPVNVDVAARGSVGGEACAVRPASSPSRASRAPASNQGSWRCAARRARKRPARRRLGPNRPTRADEPQALPRTRRSDGTVPRSSPPHHRRGPPTAEPGEGAVWAASAASIMEMTVSSRFGSNLTSFKQEGRQLGAHGRNDDARWGAHRAYRLVMLD